ncbi:TetR/AcrR family transcriptional regulator [Pedobacter gandavensis]|uniref:TetR/AcrR family transcriptional regulator n=1 Tax=Pedobacter gandavensis TaxID=2679963 RepID=UPI00292E8F41|nr:TetR/AcrR family transcriptional regulator [Pedobacter gandavensis]
MDKPSRKYAGPIRDKERTKLKLLTAVGEIIKEKGYTGLRIGKIVEKAKVDRKTLYDCFGTVDKLIETYIKGKDYYLAYEDQAEKLVKQYTNGDANELMKTLLLGQLDNFSINKEQQNILMWHLSEDNPLLSDISAKRERIGSIFLKLTDSDFQNTDIDIRARTALLVAGIYLLMLYRKSKQEQFCEIDLNSNEGMERIKASIAQMIDEAFEQAKKSKHK